MFRSKSKRLSLIAIVLLIALAFLAAPSLHAQLTQSISPRAAFAPVAVAGEASSAATGDALLPVVVNLADIAPGQYAENNMYDRWMRGEIDIRENDFRANELLVRELQLEALEFPPNANVQQIASGPGLSAPTPGLAFASLDITECCGGGSVVPPDPEMAAGPDHLIAIVNLALEIYDKTGTTVVAPTTMASFFASLGGGCAANPFDPNVIYDEETDRWIIAADGNGTHYCIAASQTSDPTGAYNLYSVPAQPVGGEFHDYPHTGVGDSYIVAGANQFGGSIPGGFEGRVWAMDKSVLYSGGALTPVTFSTGGTEGTPQPLHLHGFAQGTWPSLGSTHYFMTDPYDGCTTTLWQWNIPAAPFIVNTFNLCTATGVTGGMPVDAPQMGGSNIQANDWRMRGFEYHNGSGWVADSISCNPGGGTVNCVRFHEINLTAGTLVQAGVFASTGQHRTFPDLAVNACGDMAIGYTKTSSAMFPGIWYTGRESSDPLGTVQAEAELKAGEVTYTAFDPPPHRWGDYTGMTIDPDGVTFWYLGQYSKSVAPSTKWGTYIGAFTYPDCAPTPPPICSAPNLAIPDNNPAGVTNDLSVVESGTILDMDVSLDVTHTWVGDVMFTLQHVDTGTSVTFFDRPGVPASTFGCSGNDIAATLDDEAATPVENECGAGVPTISGSFIPNNPLSAFDGEELSGTWRLTASDHAGGDTGTVNEWCLLPTYAASGNGTLDGTVTDASTTNPIAGVSMTADDGSNNYNTSTNGSGFYAMSLPPGTYTVTASASGYLDATISGVAIVTDTTTTLDIALIVAEAIIATDPTEFVATQPVSTVVTHTLTISNLGTIDLDWTLDEEAPTSLPALPVTLPSGVPGNPADAADTADLTAPTVSNPAPRSDFVVPSGVLYDNGPLVTHPGGGAGGADASALQTALLLNVYGFGHAASTGFRVADDFTVPTGGWTLDQVLFYAYQTGSSTTSTITGVNLRIWDGPPNAGGTVIWGDTTTNVMSATTWSNIYRVLDTTLTDSARPVMVNTVEFGGLFLPEGTYWLDWQTSGSLASGPWAPPISILGQTTTGNALQFDTTNWNPLLDTGTATQQGLPFQLLGDAIPPVCSTLGDIPWASVSPITGTTAPGSSTDVAVAFDTSGLTVGNTYTGTLCLTSNDANNPLITIPLTLTVEAQSFGVDLSGDQAASTETSVVYTLTVTNTGNVADTFDLSATGVWTATLSDTSLTLGAGESATFTVEVTLPNGVLDGEVQATTVTATSQGDATATDSATLTTTAIVIVIPPTTLELFLPIISK